MAAAMDWEGKYRAGETPWDHGEAAPPMREALEVQPREVWGAGEVLVPGCGSGHDVRVLAEAGLAAVGLDLAGTAVALASGWPRAGRERYVHGDLFDPGWRAGVACTAVWEHTCFCAIRPEDRPRYVEAVAAVLAPGCFLVGVFYMRPQPRADGLPGPPFGIGEEDLVATFAPAFDWHSAWVPGLAYASRVGREWLALFRRR
jgi:SAM-dependent methyltransferase